MLIALNILEGFDLKKLGHNTPQYLHVPAEAFKLAFADRNPYITTRDLRRTLPSSNCFQNPTRPYGAG